MLEQVNIHSSVHYVQIENHVRFGIASGSLKTGDRLPSIRELSERLNLNPNTVAKAYRDLEVMGLVNTRRGMGVYINKGIEAKCREGARGDITGKLFETVCEAKAAGMALKEVKHVMEESYASVASPYKAIEVASRRRAKRK